MQIKSGRGVGVSIQTGELDNLSVTAAKLAANAVESAKIKDLNVTTAKLAALAVTAAKIAANAIDKDKLGILTTKGDTLVHSTEPARLPIGTDAQALIADSTKALGMKWGSLPNLLQVIEDYEATSAEASHTFSFSAIDFDDVSELILVIDYGATLSQELHMRVNALATDYSTNGRLISTGEFLKDFGGASEWVIMDSIMLGGVNDAAFGIIHLGLPKAGTRDRPMFHSEFYAAGGHGSQVMAGAQGTVTASLTDVVIKTSTSTWQIGTRMTLYKVARA